MDNIVRHDLKLLGDGSVGGGIFNKVSVTGEQVIYEDIDCINLKVTGTINLNKSLKAETAKVTGTAVVNGDFEADEVKIIGTLDVGGNASIKELNVHGEVKIKGDISLEKAEMDGFMSADGNCDTESFTFNGPFKIGGLLNAETIDIEAFSKCYVKEIGGKKISIRRGTHAIVKKIVKSMYMPTDFYSGQLETDCIEGDEIYLEYTKVRVVRGENVKIGPGCEIDLVEYRNNFEHRDGSFVKESRKA